MDPEVWELIKPAAKKLIAKGMPVGTLVHDPAFAIELLNEGFSLLLAARIRRYWLRRLITFLLKLKTACLDSALESGLKSFFLNKLLNQLFLWNAIS